MVFERFPTWHDCINSVDQAAFFSGLDLERFFGKQDENGIGNYARCVKYGIGREVLSSSRRGINLRLLKMAALIYIFVTHQFTILILGGEITHNASNTALAAKC